MGGDAGRRVWLAMSENRTYKKGEALGKIDGPKRHPWSWLPSDPNLSAPSMPDGWQRSPFENEMILFNIF